MGKIPTYAEFIDMAQELNKMRKPAHIQLPKDDYMDAWGKIDSFRIYQSINTIISVKQEKFVHALYDGKVPGIDPKDLPKDINKFVSYLPYLASDKIMDKLEIKRISAKPRHIKRMRIHALNVGMTSQKIDQYYSLYLKSFLK